MYLELNAILQDVFASIDGKNVGNELFDSLTAQLAPQIYALYRKYDLPVKQKIDREFAIHMFNLLVQAGGIKITEPGGKNIADSFQFDPVAAEYPEDAADESDNLDYINFEGFPEGWGDNLIGNFDGQHWAEEFKIMAQLRPEWTTDEGYLTTWFANAIMTGYDKAKQEEFPVGEYDPDAFVYLEFYNAYPDGSEDIEATFKFNTLKAAQQFVKLNGYGQHFASKYYRFYELQPTTSYKKTEIK
jgi:hypothetical protein